ncbi:MAG: FAD-dependent oxidoreductase [Rhodobacter sp.]|nr:FAD-dependent oxidoreductase [Rhodobacter sp.]
MTPTRTEVAIVGGGLSGLAIADALARVGRDYRVFEARDRVGGRILSMTGAGGRFDLGPAWIWPHNTRMLALAKRLGPTVRAQYATGTLVFEDQSGSIRRDLTFATMGDALRIAGGTALLTDALAAELDVARLHLSHDVQSIEVDGGAVHIGGVGPGGAFTMTADRVVLALPPRLAADRITFSPKPDARVLRALAAVPTWMARHAKFVAVYESAFWRDAGLSGDAISHIGPLMEVHDATDEVADVPALFGFVRPGAIKRGAMATKADAVGQLTRLFGPRAALPAQVWLKDWSTDANTATATDAALPERHPTYGLPSFVQDWAGERLFFAGTEVAPQNGGFLEGALEAAEMAVAWTMVDTVAESARV